MKKILTIVFSALIIFFSFSLPVLAQKSGGANGQGAGPSAPNINVNNVGPTANGPELCAGGKGINTALGCIDVLSGPNAFLGSVLQFAVGIGGGIAFLLIVYAGFLIMTSSGDPERLKAGQELLTSAISGLILLIFSIFILRFIGIDILQLGKFGFGQ